MTVRWNTLVVLFHHQDHAPVAVPSLLRTPGRRHLAVLLPVLLRLPARRHRLKYRPLGS